MKSTVKFIVGIFIVSLISSCQKEFSIDTNNIKGFDQDAWAFIQNSGITDSTQQSAINNLVIDLKTHSLWQKFYAIYPMAGGTPASMKWNLKDPRDADAAYRLTFNGSPLFSSSGLLCQTTADFADTHFNDAIFIFNNNSISFYSGTQNTTSGYDMGCTDSGISNEFTIYNTGDASNWFGYFDFKPMPPNTVGLFMLSATAASVARYENGMLVNSSGTPQAGATNHDILIGSVMDAPSVGRRMCEFASIGQGLSAAEAQIFSNIVQNFEVSLSR